MAWLKNVVAAQRQVNKELAASDSCDAGAETSHGHRHNERIHDALVRRDQALLGRRPTCGN